MKKEKCKGTNRFGKRCGSYPLKGSDYCKDHQPNQIKNETNAPIIRNFWQEHKSWIYVLLILVLAVSALFIALTECDVEKRDRKIDEVAIKEDQQSKKVNDKSEILKSMCTTEQNRLLKEYDSGYVLFSVDRKHAITPCPDPTIRRYEIDWNKAKIHEITATHIRLQCPDFIDKYKKGSLKGMAVRIPRDGKAIRIFKLRKFAIQAHILVDTPHGFLCVLGFKSLIRNR
jgi:hypothetical protein